MVRGKGHQSTLESCTSLISLGNTTAVHCLEYLSIAKHPPHGFRELAVDFMEVSRSLFATKAGLTEALRSPSKLSPDVSKEVHDRLEQVRAAFLVWDQMASKFLSNEKKQTFGKLGKGFRMMFAEADIEKLRVSFDQCRAALSISALMFASAYGPPKLDGEGAIGYTALAAVLHCPDPTSSKPTASKVETNGLPGSSPPPAPAPTAPLPPLPSSNSTPTPRPTSLLSHGWTPSFQDNGNKVGMFTQTHQSTSSHTTAASHPLSDRSSVVHEIADNGSDITSIMSATHETNGQTNGQVANTNFTLPTQAIRIKADAITVPRSKPSRHAGPVTDAHHAALARAVQVKDHKMMEQLLDHAVPPTNYGDHHLLRDAVMNHDIESMRLLLAYGADPNAKDREGSSPLYAATGYSNFEAAHLLLRYGADPNVTAGPYGENPLSVSLAAGKARFAQLYLQFGADMNVLMGNGDTPFTQAMNKYTPVVLVELMLLYDADVNHKNGRGETPLFKSINSNRCDLVLKLLEHKADPNMPGPKIVLWPAVHQPELLQALLDHGADLRRAPGVLELATSINSPRAVEMLLKYGADPNAKKDGIYTPLCSAIRDDHENLVNVLLKAGADPNLPALDYPIFKAITYHRTHLIPTLLKAGSNPNSPKGAIESAVAHDNKDALLYLLDKGVNPNARNAKGYTALTTAIREHHMEFIDILLAHGADPAMRGQDWPVSMAVKSPDILAKLLPYVPTSKILKGILEMAVVADQLDSVKMLIAKGVEVEEKNGGVFSPLTTSIRENRKEIFRYLVDEAGADPNSPGEHLPIIKAIRRHREDDMSYIEHLLVKGADINLMYRGWNAVLQAVDNGDLKILKLLATKGNPDLNAQDEYGRTVREIMRERRLEEEEAILLGERNVRSSSPQMKALHQLREMVL